MPTRICLDQNRSEAEQAMLERLEHSLGSWHNRIDELRQRLDLTELDIRDEVGRRVDITDNVYLASIWPLDRGSQISVTRRRLISVGCAGLWNT